MADDRQSELDDVQIIPLEQAMEVGDLADDLAELSLGRVNVKDLVVEDTDDDDPVLRRGGRAAPSTPGGRATRTTSGWTATSYERAQAAAADRAAEAAELGQGDRRADRHPLRGPRRRRQGRHDQAVHGAPQPARRAGRRAGEAHRARAAASGTSSATSRTCRRPGRSCCSTGPGTTGPASSGSWASAPTTSTWSSCAQAPELERMLVRSRHPPDQALVLGVAVRAAHPVRHPPGRPGAAVEALARWTSSRSTSGTTTPRPRRRCSSTPTPPTRRGRWSRATTRSGPGSRRCATCCSRFDYADKDHEVVGEPDPLIVGPAANLLEQGEGSAHLFPRL